MSRLIIHKSVGFSALAKSTGLTPGNLAAHLEVLTKSGHVEQELEKKVMRRKRVRITAQGDTAFREFVQTMRRLFEEVDSTP